MEENTESSGEQSPSESRKDVGFPEIVKTKKKSFGGLTLIILALIIAGFFVYSFISGGESSEKIMNEPTPTVAEENTEPTPTEIPVESKKEDLKVSILNGSGTPGLAGDLKKKIEALGFKNIETGNADSYDYASTKVSFGSQVSESIKEEVLAELKKIYGTVDSESKSVSGFDIQIVIGSKNAKSTTVSPTKAASLTPTRPTSVTPTISVTPTN